MDDPGDDPGEAETLPEEGNKGKPPTSGRSRPMPELPPDLIEGYELTAPLGRGGMGAVFRGRQISLDRTVAIKVLDPELAEDESFLRRFQQEARAVARLNHPNVVGAIDVGQSGSWHYLVMEYVKGYTLDMRMRKKGKLQESEALRVVWQVGAALRHARQHGVVHRDVKPENILITPTGDAKLCDLGLAKRMEPDGTKLTAVGTTMGTPYYISPEQIRGVADVDIRTDIYSLGATFYEMVCGRPPFDGANASVVMAKHLTEEPTPVRMLNAEVSDGAVHVIEKMLEKDREKRYQKPREFMVDVKAIAEGKWKPPVPVNTEDPVTAPIDLSELKRAQDQLKALRRKKSRHTGPRRRKR